MEPRTEYPEEKPEEIDLKHELKKATAPVSVNVSILHDLSLVQVKFGDQTLVLATKQAKDLAMALRNASNRIERNRMPIGYKPSKHSKGREKR